MNERARIEAATPKAGLSGGAGDIAAGFTDTEALNALETLFAFAIAAFAYTLALVTGEIIGTNGVVIGDTITIVIFAIADFGLGEGSGAGAPDAVGTDLGTSAASGFAGPGDVVIDLSVTVVIFAVTGFGFGLWAGTAAPFSILAHSFSLSTGTIAGFGQQVIDFSVTIVVFAVANFGFRLWSIAEVPTTAYTGFFAGATLGFAHTGETFVDFAIAVVILAIALFFGGLSSGAVDPFSGLTGFYTGTTCGLAGTYEVVVDGAITVIVEAIANFGAWVAAGCRTLYAIAIGLTDIDPLLLAFSGTGGTGFAFVGPVFVDLAVAVVVFVITDLGLWGAGLGIAFDTAAVGFALPDASTFTDAQTCFTTAAFVGPGFINFAVAIIVFAVAEFCFGLRRGAIDPFACATSFCASAAGCLARLCEAIVDFSVTIVIFVIASFGFCGAALGGTDQRFFVWGADVGALLGAGTNASGTGFAFVGPVFVGLSVTVVVEIITYFLGCGVGDGIESTVNGIDIGCVVSRTGLTFLGDGIEQRRVKLNPDDKGFDAIFCPQVAGFCLSIARITGGIAVGDEDQVIGAIFGSRRFLGFEAAEV